MPVSTLVGDILSQNWPLNYKEDFLMAAVYSIFHRVCTVKRSTEKVKLWQ